MRRRSVSSWSPSLSTRCEEPGEARRSDHAESIPGSDPADRCTVHGLLAGRPVHHRGRHLILQAAQLEGGAYEWRQHVPIALGVGVTQAQIDAVERGLYDDAALNAAERALLTFGREVVEKVRVGDAAFAGVRKHFSEQEIVEAIIALGFYMMMARLTEATETDLDPAAGMAVYEGGKKRG